jgi:hypothetical protein
MGPNRKVMVSRFSHSDPLTNAEQAALIVGIDIYKYLATLDELGVRREDFLDSFVPARRPRD